MYSRVCLGPKDSSGHRERQLTRGGQPKTSLLRPPKLRRAAAGGNSQYREVGEPEADPNTSSAIAPRTNYAAFFHSNASQLDQCPATTSAMLLWKNSMMALPRRLAMCWSEGQAGKCEGI